MGMCRLTPGPIDRRSRISVVGRGRSRVGSYRTRRARGLDRERSRKAYEDWACRIRDCDGEACGSLVFPFVS